MQGTRARRVLRLAILLLAALASEPARAADRGDGRDELSKLINSIPSKAPRGGLAGYTSQLNGAMNSLYAGLSGEIPREDLDLRITQLAEILARLETCDIRLQDLNTGTPDVINAGYVKRDRALCFLRAWPAFGRLVVQACRRDRDSSLRERLLWQEGVQGKPSVLSYLLLIYDQIRAGEGDAADPLRVRLADGTLFDLELAYKQDWLPKERPASIDHDRYVPLTADLVGSPDDPPALNKRQFLSLWALVNLQLDTWHGKDFEISPLSKWLLALAEQEHLRKGFGSGGQGGGLAEAFQPRISRLGKFVRFRSVTTDPARLREVIEGLHKARTEPGTTIAQVVPDLLDAATPVLDDGGATRGRGEWVRDAEIWLRYLLLLSYRTDSVVLVAPTATSGFDLVLIAWGDGTGVPTSERNRVIVGIDSNDQLHVRIFDQDGKRIVDTDETKLPPAEAQAVLTLKRQLRDLQPSHALTGAEKARIVIAATSIVGITPKNCLSVVWMNLEPVVPLMRSRDRSEKRPPTGFLRWNRDPDEGHSTAVLADLVHAVLAYRIFDSQMSSLEVDRFGTMTSGSEDSRSAIAEKIDAALVGLKTAAQDTLKPYRQGGVLEPLPAIFRGSTTSSEEGRWYRDVNAVRGHIEGALERATLLAELYRAPKLTQSVPAMERLGSLSGIANWNVNEMPRRTFRWYHEDLEKQIIALNEGVAVEETGRRLRSQYQRSREQLEIAQLEQRAARLGSVVAEKAVRVSELFERVASIDAEIADLGVRIAKVQAQAASKDVDGAGLRLAYATRLRDLAAARVQALEQASSDATEIARKAEDELQALANRFEDIAKKIKEEKESAGLFGIIKAVVNVVGAVLAPFTYGASLAVAQLANKGLDVYQKIDKGNWSDPFAAVATVSEVAGDLQNAVNFGVKELGSAGASQALADVQTFLTSARDKIDQLKTLSQKGQQVLNAFKAVEKGDAARFVTALTNGFPMTIDAGGGLKIDLGAKKIEFKNPELQSALKDLYALGGHIVNDATSREWMKDLPSLPDSLLRGKLKEAVERGVQALPPDVREQVLKLPKTAEDKLQGELAGAREKLANVAESGLSEEERRVLASALAGGMLFVQNGEVVVAFERPLDRELQRLQERMKRVAERAYSDTIQNLLAKLEEKRNSLSRRADEMAGKNDNEGLKQLANETKEEKIPSIKKDVSEVRKELEKAREELEDKETKAKIAKGPDRNNL